MVNPKYPAVRFWALVSRFLGGIGALSIFITSVVLATLPVVHGFFKELGIVLTGVFTGFMFYMAVILFVEIMEAIVRTEQNTRKLVTAPAAAAKAPAPPARCSQCKAPLAGGALFCESCGNRTS